MILFALAMNLVIKSAEMECGGPLSKSGVWQPPIRAYMDDLTITTTSVPALQVKSMVLKRPNNSVFQCQEWSFITDQPVKSKIFDSSLKDFGAIQNLNQELGTWLIKVDKSDLLGRFGPTSFLACPTSCGPCWSMQSQ